jgi:type IV pilus assembly protein PilA
VVEDAAVVPVAWVCGHAATPEKMSAKGINRTDVAAQFLPLNCRGR